MQTKRESLIEASVNVLAGYIAALLAQLVVFPIFNISVNFKDQMIIALIFLLVSLTKTYIIRRVFNYRLHKKYKDFLKYQRGKK